MSIYCYSYSDGVKLSVQNPLPSVLTPSAPTTCSNFCTCTKFISNNYSCVKKTNNNHSYGYYFGIDYKVVERNAKNNGNKNHDNKSKPKQNSASWSGHTD